jgi:hypothetical protein
MKTLSHLPQILFVILISISNLVTAQGDDPEELPDFSRTSFFIEWRGNAYTSSLNVDHLINRQFSIRVGISSIFSTSFTAPIMLNYLAGQDTHFLELGIGALVGRTYIFDETDGGGIVSTMTIGYRWQPPDGGFLLRAGFTPFIFPSEINFFQPWGGISLGYTFR